MQDIFFKSLNLLLLSIYVRDSVTDVRVLANLANTSSTKQNSYAQFIQWLSQSQISTQK